MATASCDFVQLDRWDFVDSDDEGDIEDASEDPFQYLHGFFCPIRIGDILNDRYQVIHKLGRGGFSTVWLAHDRQLRQDVPLKILASAEYAALECDAHLHMAQKIRDRTRVVLCQDHFVLSRTHIIVPPTHVAWTNIKYSSTTRKHVVLVLQLRGPSLSTILRKTMWSLNYRMSAAKQLLQAVLSIHDAGMVHRGK